MGDLSEHFAKREFACKCGKSHDFNIDPELIEKIIRKAGVAHTEVTMIGDSSVDIQTAHNAHIRSIGVSWGFRSRTELEQACPTHIVDNMDQLRKLLMTI